MSPASQVAGGQIDRHLDDRANRVDAEIEAPIFAVVDDGWTRGSIHYHLVWADAVFTALPVDQRAPGGKKLRSALALVTYQAAMVENSGPGPDIEAPSPWPPPLTSPQLHPDRDDIEDRDRIRRGRPTLWALYRQAQAIKRRQHLPRPGVQHCSVASTSAVSMRQVEAGLHPVKDGDRHNDRE